MAVTDGLNPIVFDIEVWPEGIRLTVGPKVLCTFTPECAASLGPRLAEAVELWEKHFRAFVHDSARLH